MTPTLADQTVTVVATHLIGFRRDGDPIYLHHGAQIDVSDDEGPDDDDELLPEDDEDEDGDEQDDESDDADDDEIQDGWEPPSRDQWEKLLAGQRRNNQENARLRNVKKQLTSRGIDLDTDDGQEKLADLLNGLTFGDKSATNAERAMKRAVARKAAEVEATYKPILVNAAIDSALAAAQWSGTPAQREKLFGRLDMDDFDLADGKITGADDIVEDAKDTFPEYFQANRPAPARRTGARDVDGGNRRGKAAEQPKGWKEQLNAQMNG